MHPFPWCFLIALRFCASEEVSLDQWASFPRLPPLRLDRCTIRSPLRQIVSGPQLISAWEILGLGIEMGILFPLYPLLSCMAIIPQSDPKSSSLVVYQNL